MESKLHQAVFYQFDDEKARDAADKLRTLGVDVLGPEFVQFDAPSDVFGDGYWLIVWDPIYGRIQPKAPCVRCKDRGWVAYGTDDIDVCDCVVDGVAGRSAR